MKKCNLNDVKRTFIRYAFRRNEIRKSKNKVEKTEEDAHLAKL